MNGMGNQNQGGSMAYQKAVYLIGGGPLAVRAILWAKEMGLIVVVSDRNIEAPGLYLADYSAQIDASDETGRHEEFIDSLPDDVKVCGIYCGNEIGMHTANRLRRYLGLEAVDQVSMAIVADKIQMKDCWKTSGIPTPHSTSLSTIDDFREYMAFNPGMQVVKPSLGSGSRGVQVVSDTDDLAIVWETALLSVDYQGDVLVEPYVIGRHIDANGVFVGGKYYKAGTLEKYITDWPDCLPLGGNDPANINAEQDFAVHQLMEDSCRAIGITSGPVKGDLILDADGTLFILEVSTRLHGDVTTCNTLPFGSGCNPLKFMFEFWKTGVANIKHLNSQRAGYGAWRVLCLPPGQACLQEPTYGDSKPENVTMVWFNPKHSADSTKYSNTAEIPGYICGYGKDKSEAERYLGEFFRTIRPRGYSDYSPWYVNLGETLKQRGLSLDSCGYSLSENS